LRHLSKPPPFACLLTIAAILRLSSAVRSPAHNKSSFIAITLDTLLRWANRSNPPLTALSIASVRERIERCLRPDRFFAAVDLRLVFDHRPEEVLPWEIFRGRLLDLGQTRERQSFEVWHVSLDADEGRLPILSVLHDVSTSEVFMIRGMRTTVWEGYEAQPNIFLSRQAQRWVRELIGRIDIKRCADADDFEIELSCLLFQAVVGTSRLPLTSTEAPLPIFSLGQFAYIENRLDKASTVPTSSAIELVRSLWLQPAYGPGAAKHLEFLLRALPVDQLADLAGDLSRELRRDADRQAADLMTLLRCVFNDVSLTPYTDFVTKTLRLVALLETIGTLSTAEHLDFLAYLLRQLGRHLTAYDLITFHHRGANYPDMLLLDEILEAFLRLATDSPHLFAADSRGLKRRAALRQAVYLRCRYEGLPVPHTPTSPGENARVLPEAFAAADEEITNPAARTSHLFSGRPLEALLNKTIRNLLATSFADLQFREQVQELGMAIYLARPLGVLKPAGEPDRTPLFSYLAFSQMLVDERWRFLRDVLAPRLRISWPLEARDPTKLSLEGVSLSEISSQRRPTGVALADAAAIDSNFIFLAMTQRSRREFLSIFALDSLSAAPGLENPLVLSAPDSEQMPGVLIVRDDKFVPRLRLQIGADQGYVSRRGLELPCPGLRIIGTSSDGTRWLHIQPAFTLGPNWRRNLSSV
jgi:hypothetical protein